VDEPPVLPDSSQQVKILEDRVRAKATDLLVGAPSHEECRIAVTQSQTAEPGIEPGQEASGAVSTAEDDPEVSTDDLRISKRLGDPLGSIVSVAGIEGASFAP
jgi:hypothetical protein